MLYYCLLYDSVSSLFHFVTSFVLLVIIYFIILSGYPRVDNLCLYQNMPIGNICTYGAKDLKFYICYKPTKNCYYYLI